MRRAVTGHYPSGSDLWRARCAQALATDEGLTPDDLRALAQGPDPKPGERHGAWGCDASRWHWLVRPGRVTRDLVAEVCFSGEAAAILGFREDLSDAEIAAIATWAPEITTEWLEYDQRQYSLGGAIQLLVSLAIRGALPPPAVVHFLGHRLPRRRPSDPWKDRPLDVMRARQRVLEDPRTDPRMIEALVPYGPTEWSTWEVATHPRADGGVVDALVARLAHERAPSHHGAQQAEEPVKRLLRAPATYDGPGAQARLERLLTLGARHLPLLSTGLQFLDDARFSAVCRAATALDPAWALTALDSGTPTTEEQRQRALRLVPETLDWLLLLPRAALWEEAMAAAGRAATPGPPPPASAGGRPVTR